MKARKKAAARTRTVRRKRRKPASRATRSRRRKKKSTRRKIPTGSRTAMTILKTSRRKSWPGTIRNWRIIRRCRLAGVRSAFGMN
jgi:hypothetical protein